MISIRQREPDYLQPLFSRKPTTLGNEAVALFCHCGKHNYDPNSRCFSPNKTVHFLTISSPDISLYQPLFSRKGDDTGKRSRGPFLPLWKADDPGSLVFIPTGHQGVHVLALPSPYMSRERWHTEHVQFGTYLTSLIATTPDVRQNRVKRPD